jgi:hypothetical protein
LLRQRLLALLDLPGDLGQVSVGPCSFH